jgi:ATP phosphoribosyltransferase regulatory subunit
MTITKRWLLPEGVDEILPPRAILLEQMCRKLIDLFSSWGYEFVIPPMMEYLESLLTATGEDLDLQTYKITDQLSGRLMGIRADITPQVARIDAHLLKRNIPTRLCYLGSVLHSRTNNSGDSRSPLQLGAELFGHEGVSSDIEIVKLMLATLDAVRISNICLDVGHIGIFRSLISKSQLNSMQESEVFEIVKRKAKDELKIFYKKLKINDDSSKAMLDLIDLHGDAGILDDAIHAFDKLSPDIRKYVNEVKTLTDSIIDKFDVSINIDLSELRGYNYHTGMIYTAFVPNEGKGIAFGGRYDDIGSAFGKARPATGFSTDMKQLLELQNISEDTPDKIFAPVDDNDSLQKKITELREQGKIVIQELEGQNATAKEMNCSQTLVCENDRWVVKENKK